MKVKPGGFVKYKGKYYGAGSVIPDELDTVEVDKAVIEKPQPKEEPKIEVKDTPDIPDSPKEKEEVVEAEVETKTEETVDYVMRKKRRKKKLNTGE